MKWAKSLWFISVLALVACSEAKRTNDPAQILSAFELQYDRASLNENLSENGIPVGVLMAIPPVGAVTVCNVGNFVDKGVSNAHCLYEALSKEVRNFYLIYLDKQTFEKRIARVTKLTPGSAKTDDTMIVHFDGSQRDHWASLNIARDAFAKDTKDSEFNLLAFDPGPTGAVFSRKTCKAVRKKGFEIADGPKEEERRYYSDPSQKDLTYEHTVVLDEIDPTTVPGDSGGTVVDSNGDAVAVFKWHAVISAFRRNQYYLTNQSRWQAINGVSWHTLVGIATDISAIRF